MPSGSFWSSRMADVTMLDLFSTSTDISSFFWASGVSTGVILFGALVLFALSIASYRRTPGMPTWLRIVLLVSRAVALVLIASLIFEPTFSLIKTQETKKRLPVMIDVSQSMSIVDQRKSDVDIAEAAVALGFVSTDSASKESRDVVMDLDGNQRQSISKTSRLDLAQTLLTNASNTIFKEMADEVNVDYYSFGSDIKMLKQGEDGSVNSLAALKAVESSTSVTDSLKTLVHSDRGTPLAGIVLLTDGLDTSLRRAEATMSELGDHGVPIYPIPMGIPDPDDVSIRNIIIQEVAFSGDKVPVRVQVKSKGYEKRTARLSVKLNGNTVSQKNVTFEGGLQFEDIFFHIEIYEKGAAKVEVIIDPFEDEATEENNRVERSIRVVNEKINILCIEGSARWEYRYLRAMLKRDFRFETTFIATRSTAEMARNSTEYIERFPESREEAFKYDLVILGDVAADFFSTEEYLRLEELVRDRGGSLLVLFGSRDTPSSYGGTILEKMLPVEFEEDMPWEPVDDGVYPVLTPEGRSSLVMTLESDQETNDRIWSGVAPLDQLPAIHSPKPGATVLAELSEDSSEGEGYPLVSWQRYGTGKCMAIATDRLWLLRFKLGDKYHWRVWSQSIQFLTLSRLMGEHKRIRLETDRSSYQPGEKVLLYAHVLDDEFNPVSRSNFSVVVSPVDGTEGMAQPISLVPNTKKPGFYEGFFSPPKYGRYELKANADDEDLSNSTEFQVANLNPEMARTDTQMEKLHRIAEISGGRVISMKDFDSLADIIDRSPHISQSQIDSKLWGGGWLAFFVMALIGFEWIVRRRYDLP